MRGDTQTIRVAIVGCGNIAGPYLADMLTRPQIRIVGLTDALPEKAEALAAAHPEAGLIVYRSLDEMLADSSVELVVNLTVHTAHEAVSRRILEAGRHVYSEKPLAMTYAGALALLELAGRMGRRIGCSPFAPLGESAQTAWRLIRDGRLGRVRVAYADVNWGRLETWHPDPVAFYDIGALWDVGVYPLTLLTGWLAPARRVDARGWKLWPERRRPDGTSFMFRAPDFVLAAIELEDGTLVRLTTNFYVSQKGRQAGMELHGDAGSLWIGSWFTFNAPVEFGRFNEPYEDVPLLREAHPLRWGYGVAELVDAIGEDRPHRVSGEQAAHIVETLEAVETSMREGAPVEVRSSFPAPEPMDWAR